MPLLANPLLRHLVYDERILSVAREILRDQPIYFGDCNYSIVNEDYREGRDVGGYHRDNTDRTDPAAPDWKDEYPVIRFGIYLQDHTRHGGGLLLVAKSHQKLWRRRHEIFRHRYMNTAAGDLLVWNMRIKHAGMGRFIRGFPSLPITQGMQKLIPEFLHSPPNEENRAAIFLTYGRKGPLFDRYLEYLKTRTYTVEAWKKAEYDPAALAECERRGLKVLPMKEEIERLIAAGIPVGFNQKWRKFPY